MQKLTVDIKVPEPTISIQLGTRSVVLSGRIELTKQEFLDLFTNMQEIYNENYEILENDNDDF